MTLSPAMTLGSFLVAVMVGLTGMGGGALLTPMLMLVFGVPPLAAVSSDLVVSAITKPVGALVHLRRRTVHLRLAGWLSIGSVPAAFAGGLIGWWLGPGNTVQTVTSHTTGVVLVIAAGGIAYRMFGVLTARPHPAGGVAGTGGPHSAGGGGTGAARHAGAGDYAAQSPSHQSPAVGPASQSPAVGAASQSQAVGPACQSQAVGPASQSQAVGSAAQSRHISAESAASRSGLEVQGWGAPPLVVRQVPTVLIGILVGLAVGITSTGSGTLVIAALTALYPALPPNRLVGTDLAQAVPMVLSAALAHIIAGNVVMSVTAPLLVGGIPGVILGSLLASVAPSGALRPVLSLVILASGLSLLGVAPIALVVVLVCVLAASVLLVISLRRRNERRHASHMAAGDTAGNASAGNGSAASNLAPSSVMSGKSTASNSLRGNPAATNSLPGNPAAANPLPGNPAGADSLRGSSLLGNPVAPRRDKASGCGKPFSDT